MSPARVDPSQKPTAKSDSDSKNMRVTKRLRQATGESAKMRSSQYENMKEAAKSGQQQTFVPQEGTQQDPPKNNKNSPKQKKKGTALKVAVETSTDESQATIKSPTARRKNSLPT